MVGDNRDRSCHHSEAGRHREQGKTIHGRSSLTSSIILGPRRGWLHEFLCHGWPEPRRDQERPPAGRVFHCDAKGRAVGWVRYPEGHMRVAVKWAGLAAVMAILTPSLSAQWTRFPTPNVPKNAAGQPDLNAPAPKTADGKPDLSGTWRGGGAGPGRGRGAAADAPPPAGPPVAGFANVGQNI